MANVKISDIATTATDLTGTVYYEIEQDGVGKKLPQSVLAAAVAPSMGVVAQWNGNGSSGTVGSPNRANNLTLTRLAAGVYAAAFDNAQPDAYYNPVFSASLDYGVRVFINVQLNFNANTGLEVAPTTAGFTFSVLGDGDVTYDPKYLVITVTR